MPSIKVKQDQSLVDVALQEYGSVYGVFRLVEDNTRLLGPTDTLFEGDSLHIRTDKIHPQRVDYLRQTGIATAKGATGEGIGYWTIGRDFVVS